MSFDHPYRDALVNAPSPNVGDISEAVERHTPFVAHDLADIRTRDLARSWVVELRTGTTIRRYVRDPSSTLEDDGETCIWDNQDRPFVLQGEAWGVAVKSADEAITSDAVLGEDAELRFAMLPNQKYHFRGRVWFDTAATPDFKYRHSGPASPTLVRIHRRHIVPGTTADAGIAVDTAYSAADIAIAGGGTTGGWVEIEGIIHNGANAGDFVISWAQNTSDAGATTVRAGSFVEYRSLSTAIQESAGSAAAERLVSEEVASTSVSGHRIVALDAGEVRHASNETLGDAYLALGLSLNAAVLGDPVSVVSQGVVVNAGWNWTPGAPVFLGGTAGQLSQTAPTAPAVFSLMVGRALAADTLYVSLEMPVEL